jgi:CRP-like cAMP-binding protein
MNHSHRKTSIDGLDPLDRVGWLSEQPVSFRNWVAENGRWRRYAAGETIYLAGDEPDGMYGLGSGALDIAFPLQSDEPVAIHRAEPGFWIGEAALMAGATRLISLTAAADSRVYHIPVTALRGLLERDPGCWRILYEQSFGSLSRALTLLAEALALSPRARLSRLLLRLANEEGRVYGNQDEFSRLIGMTRSSVRRALASLVETGAIRTGYRWLDIVDATRLAEISNEA